MNVDFNKIDDTWLQILQAMLKECWFHVEGTLYENDYADISSAFNKELKQRNLETISIYSNIEPLTSRFGSQRTVPEPLPAGLSVSNLTETQVKILYALGAEIADFSCLGNGIRKYVESVWLNFQTEMEKRNIEREFFCDF